MTKEQYSKMRNELMNEAEVLITAGKIEESEAKMNEIKELDNKWDETKKAQANLNALKDNHTVADIAAQSVKVAGAEVIDALEPSNPTDEKDLYVTAWAKEMMGKTLDDNEKVTFENFNSRANNAIQTASKHAVLIPETVRDGIWREAQELFPILNDTRITFVPGDLTIIKEVNGGDDAEWYDEETVTGDSEFELGELNLSGCELAKAIPISWKFRKMTQDQFISYIQTLLAEKMGAALAKGLVVGRGKPGVGDTFKPQPKGVITALDTETNTPQIVEFETSISYDDLAKAMGKIKSTYKSGASIYATSTMIWDYLATLKDENGRPILIPDVTSGGVGRIFGLTVKEDDSVPAESILIGNFSRGYVCNANEDISIYTEDHVKKRYTDYMGYAIVDGDVATTKAFALIRKEVEEI